MGNEDAGKTINAERFFRAGENKKRIQDTLPPQMVMIPKAPTITGSPIGTAINRMIQILPETPAAWRVPRPREDQE